MARQRINLGYMRPVEEQTAEEFAAAFSKAMMAAIAEIDKEAAFAAANEEDQE